MSRRELIVDLVIRAIFMAVVYAVFASMLPSYRTVAGIGALLDGAVLIGLTAAGLGVTMLAAEFDLSVGSLAAVIGVLAINLIATGMSIPPAILIAVAAAAAFGCFQGFVIAVTGINSLVFTIGTLIGLRGFALIISGENSVTMPIARLAETDFLVLRVFGIFTPLSIIMIAVFVLVGLFLRYTVWGREIYAIGGGRAEARAAGVSIIRPMMIAFGLSASLAGLAGALLSGPTGQCDAAWFRYLAALGSHGVPDGWNRPGRRPRLHNRDFHRASDLALPGRRGRQPWGTVLDAELGDRRTAHFRHRRSDGHQPSSAA